MRSLREVQLAFAQGLTGAPVPEIEPLIAPTGMSAARRLQIYRNNFVLSLRGALEAVFPVVRRLVGEEFFGYAARRYIDETPSISGDLHDFGDVFPHFLGALPEARDLPYLSDIARLEWAYHRVFHAADAEPIALDRLAAIAPADWPSLGLALAPASRLVHSPYPVLRIWQMNQEGWQGEAALNLDAGGEDVLVLRRDGDIGLIALGAGELALLSALAAGDVLEKAVASALAVDGAFDLGGCLARHFVLGTFAGLSCSQTC